MPVVVITAAAADAIHSGHSSYSESLPYPEDVPFGTSKWDAVSAEFMPDLCRVMSGDPDQAKRIGL
ncbi:hypothetical protein J2W46_004195 [Paraburkholderia strydomiana]|nr:hypothetical protein [Paraburkholderia strydomiana]